MLNSKDKLPEAEGLGVIVARFQNYCLTDGHIDLINSVIARHTEVLIVLGVSPINTSTSKNPLDYETRRLMVKEWVETDLVTVDHLKDTKCNSTWSANLDDLIQTHIPLKGKATLYGGRDCFKQYYSGKFPVVEFEPNTEISATELRESVHEVVDKSHEDFRKGVIWATQNRFPTVYPVVDAAIFNKEKDQILLGRKPGETGWRFIGGFVDPEKGLSKNTLESTVNREVFEEASIEVTNIKYSGSYFINDWRYRGEEDSVMSVLFTCEYYTGTPKGSDDIEEVSWFPFNSETLSKIGPNAHKVMFKDLTRKFGSK